MKWVEFPAGPQLLEGLNVGAVDVGFVGEAPPIFAQAAGARFVYIGFDPAAPEAEAIVVPKDSPIRSVAELKGRKVALNKGSNVHYLLVKALEKQGLKFSDVQAVYLPPADARAAFERGAVDAWVIWDPFLAAVEKQSGARLLQDGKGIVNNYAYYLAERGYAEKQPQVIQALFDDTQAPGRGAEGQRQGRSRRHRTAAGAGARGRREEPDALPVRREAAHRGRRRRTAEDRRHLPCARADSQAHPRRGRAARHRQARRGGK